MNKETIKETITDIREKAYREMFDFINWFATKHKIMWRKLCEEYRKELKKK